MSAADVLLDLLKVVALIAPFAAVIFFAWLIESFHRERARIDREHVRWLAECRKTGRYE
jgi:hypothetical protein